LETCQAMATFALLQKQLLRATCAGFRVRCFAGSSGLLPGGKHRGLTFEDCYAKDPSYCSWLLKRGDEMGPAYADFMAFLRSRTMVQSEEPSHNSGSMFAGHAAVHDLAPPRGGNPTDELGDDLVGFGKYRALSYRDVVSQDSEYCRWVKQHYASEAGADAAPAFKQFASYLEGCELPAEVGRQRQSPPSRSPSRANVGMASFGAKPASFGATPRPGREKPGSLVDGQWPVTFGNKYKDWTFAEVLKKDKEYCEYVVNLVLNKEEQVSVDMLAFTVFVQHQAFVQAQ